MPQLIAVQGQAQGAAATPHPGALPHPGARRQLASAAAEPARTWGVVARLRALALNNA
jgi:hypothetical protein